MSNKINLTLPVDPAYVSAARLTASSVANRMGFDIDEIEDIKAAVSEASTFIIKHSKLEDNTSLQISFEMELDKMRIDIAAENVIMADVASDDMGLLMIKALIDEFEYKNSKADKCATITMLKNHKAIIFEP